MFTIANWNYSHYKTGPLKVLLSCGVDPDQKESVDELSMVYWLTVSKDDSLDVYQNEFDNLGSAITEINTKYGHWDFVDTTKDNGAGGCGSCEAK